MYELGRCLKKNEDDANKYYKIAAEMGDHNAM
jgi:TPR repeat protein